MKLPKILDPNAEMPANNILWYFLALFLMGGSILVCLTGVWQTDGFVTAMYKNGKIIRVADSSPANDFSIVPSTISVVWSIIIYVALLARRYVRNVSNLPTLILVAANIFFAASLIESFLPAQSISLLRMFGTDLLTLNPQTLLIAVVLLSWIGMRSLSGLSILILGLVFLARAQDINQSLGMWGSLYVLCGFLSLMIQLKLPYMIPEGGLVAALLQDFGAIRIAAARNVAELQSDVQTAAAVVAASVASGTPPSVQLDSGNARQIVQESDAVKS